jgi:hypothetical protein
LLPAGSGRYKKIVCAARLLAKQLADFRGVVVHAGVAIGGGGMTCDILPASFVAMLSGRSRRKNATTI